MQLSVRSQVYVLREKLQEAGVGHNQRVVADVPDVLVSQGVAYFCDVPQVVVTGSFGVPDGQELPHTAFFEGFGLVADGLYDLNRVQIFTNGRIQITRLPETELVPVSAE